MVFTCTCEAVLYNMLILNTQLSVKSRRGLFACCCSVWNTYFLRDVESCFRSSFKHHDNSTRTQKQVLKSMLELSGKFQTPNQITAWQLGVTLGLALAVVWENGGALLWAVSFLNFHRRWNRHSKSSFSHLFIYIPGLLAGTRWWWIGSPKSLEGHGAEELEFGGHRCFLQGAA